jgi:competence protein ComEC
VLEAEPGVPLEVLIPAAVLFVGSGADRNNNAVVLRLVYGSVSFLLASDIEACTEDYLVRTSFVLESIVLKAVRHGSRSSIIPTFLGQVNPAVAVISPGSGNQFGHSHPEVANRLEEALGLERIFRTDR